MFGKNREFMEVTMNKEFLVIWDNQVRKFSEIIYARRFYKLMKCHNIDCRLYLKFDKTPKLYELEKED